MTKIEKVKQKIADARIRLGVLSNKDYPNNKYETMGGADIETIQACLILAQEISEKGMYWKPIESAPKDEVVFLKLEDETLIKASLRGGFMDSDGEDCFCWVAEQEYFPECWSCGECYEYNADGNRSIHPTAWQPLPTNTILELLEKIGE